MKLFFRILSVLFCLILSLMSAGCKHKTPDPGDEIICYSITYEPDSLDPQIADDASARLIVMNIFEGLVRLDDKEQPIPGAASKWTISDDGLIYTFHLRDDARWSNGEQVTADDFAFGISRTIAPETNSKGADDLFSIKNAEAVHLGKMSLSSLGVYANGQLLIIELAYPDPDFLTALTSPGAMPCNKSYFTASGGQYGRDADKIISNGPFYIRRSGWSHEEYIYLRQNPEYSGEHKPVPAGVNISIASPPDNVCRAICDGSIDCYMLPGAELDQAKKNHLNLTSFGETVWGISFNTTNEILQHEEIRHALLAALDKNQILRQVPDGCRVVNDIIPDSVRYNGFSYRSHAPSGLCIPFSETAKDELKNAMAKLKIDSLPKLTILCTDDEATQGIVNSIIEKWNDLTGSYINKNPVSSSELNNAVQSGEYRVVIAPLVADGNSPVNTLELFSTGSVYNSAKLSDEKYDSIVEDIHTLPENEAMVKIIEAEQFLNDKGVFYPLYAENRYYASSENVTGIIFHPFEAGIDFAGATKLTNS